jgi:high-affinity iron transporter
MIASALIVFREVFECALVVGIVLAATQGVLHRGRWIGAGVAGGVAGAGMLALFAGAIANAVQGMGQELLNASVLLIAVAMLGWHNVWMSRHGRELAASVNEVGRKVAAGTRPLYALAIVAGLASLREGSEVVLFLWGIAATDTSGSLSMLSGGLLGLTGGVAVGVALYLGLLAIPQRYIFSVTSWMILLLAAGMAAQGAGFLVQAGWLPPLGEPVWDTSSLLRDSSPIGKALHTLVGYTSRPAGIQVVFYLLALGAIGALMKLLGSALRAPVRVGTAVLIGGLALTGAANPAAAVENKVFHPIAVQGETELEFRGFNDHFNAGGTPDFQNRTVEVGYGLTDWWFTELEFEYQQGGGEFQNYTHTAKATENVFVLAPQGTYAIDLGAFVEAEFAQRPGDPDEYLIGPLLQTQTGQGLHTLNVIFHGEFGVHPDPTVELNLSWQTRWLLHLHFQPGFEVYSSPGDWTHFKPQSGQTAQAGPVIFGMWIAGRGYNIKYEVGQLYGLTRASPDQTTKFMLEVEHVF